MLRTAVKFMLSIMIILSPSLVDAQTKPKIILSNSAVSAAWQVNDSAITQSNDKINPDSICSSPSNFKKAINPNSKPLQIQFNTPDIAILNSISFLQSENSIFISPLNDNVILNSNNSNDFPTTQGFGASSFKSNDGGLTWSGSQAGAGGTNKGDPAAVIGLNGRFLYWLYCSE